MTKFTVEFGSPEECEYFINTHERFFERFDNLQSALHAAFEKVNVSREKIDIIVLVISNICVDDFSEILLLCANGFGNGALKILRGMYEKLVVARYLHLHPEEADAFWNFYAVGLSKMKFPDILEKIDPDGKILDQFKNTPKNGGGKKLQASWTKKDFVSMANEVGLGEEIRNAYYLPLKFAHPSVYSILTKLEVKNNKLNVKSNEPQRDTAKIAFPIAYFFILEVLRLQIEHFGLDVNNPIFQQCIDDYKYALGRSDLSDSKGK